MCLSAPFQLSNLIISFAVESCGLCFVMQWERPCLGSWNCCCWYDMKLVVNLEAGILKHDFDVFMLFIFLSTINLILICCRSWRPQFGYAKVQKFLLNLAVL